jgi:hypothetical protein
MIGKNIDDINEIKLLLKVKFEMDDRRPVNFILGIKVTRDRYMKTPTLNQTRFTNELLTKYAQNNDTMKTQQMINIPFQNIGA